MTNTTKDGVCGVVGIGNNQTPGRVLNPVQIVEVVGRRHSCVPDLPGLVVDHGLGIGLKVLKRHNLLSEWGIEKPLLALLIHNLQSAYELPRVLS